MKLDICSIPATKKRLSKKRVQPPFLRKNVSFNTIVIRLFLVD